MADADATLPLQKAVIEHLKATGTVSALVGTKVFTRPTPAAAKPYVSLGPWQSLREHADEYVGADTAIQIDGWAAGPEATEVMKLGRAIDAALDGAELTLVDDQRLVSLKVEQTRYLTDPDGIGQHAVVILRARTEPTI